MNPQKHVMFFAIGFETTAPSTALTLQRAKAEGIHNFSVFCNHVTIIPAIRAILDSPDMRLDGFIGPGHVSTVIGCRPYEWIAKNEHKPIVVCGFEPLDLLQSIVMMLPSFKRAKRRLKISTSASCRGKAIARRCEPWPIRFSFARISNGAAWDSSRNQRCAFATNTPNGIPNSDSMFREFASPIPKPRSAARC